MFMISTCCCWFLLFLTSIIWENPSSAFVAAFHTWMGINVENVKIFVLWQYWPIFFLGTWEKNNKKRIRAKKEFLFLFYLFFSFHVLHEKQSKINIFMYWKRMHKSLFFPEVQTAWGFMYHLLTFIDILTSFSCVALFTVEQFHCLVFPIKLFILSYQDSILKKGCTTTIHAKHLKLIEFEFVGSSIHFLRF